MGKWTETTPGVAIPGDHSERLKRTEEKARLVLYAWHMLNMARGKACVVSSGMVADEVHDSPRSVRYHLTWLAERGYLSIKDARRGVAATYAITRKGRNFIRKVQAVALRRNLA